jgi:hypothetical protein
MIEENVKSILGELPEGVQLVAATKDRTVEEIITAIEAGVEIIGENYIQSAQDKYSAIGDRCRWHFIGHLQRNKVKYAIEMFDMIETVDSKRLAKEIDKRCKKKEIVMPVLVEVNSGREPQKYGIMPEDVVEFVREISGLKNIKIEGLMTMGPFTGDPENARPYFVITRELFEKLKSEDLPDVDMRYLSMGMTNSYRIAVEEGANIVRIGTKIFGPR